MIPKGRPGTPRSPPKEHPRGTQNTEKDALACMGAPFSQNHFFRFSTPFLSTFPAPGKPHGVLMTRPWAPFPSTPALPRRKWCSHAGESTVFKRHRERHNSPKRHRRRLPRSAKGPKGLPRTTKGSQKPPKKTPKRHPEHDPRPTKT